MFASNPVFFILSPSHCRTSSFVTARTPPITKAVHKVAEKEGHSLQASRVLWPSRVPDAEDTNLSPLSLTSSCLLHGLLLIPVPQLGQVL